MGRVAALGCIVCLIHVGAKTRPEDTCIHHIKWQTGIGRRSSHYEVLPLCFRHHDAGIYGESFHAGRGIWEITFGSQLDLLDEVRRMLA